MWGESDYLAMTRIYALVWVTFRLTPAWPRECRLLPRHSHASLDDRYVRPVIRSCIGVGQPTPLTILTTHTIGHTGHSFTEGHTMNIRHSLTIPAIALAVIGAGLSIGASLPEPAPHPTVGVGQPTPTEDSPGWNCLTDGNRICGDPDETRATPAWEAWDAGEGPRKLRVDPSRPFRVEYVGYATESPNVTGDDVALVGKDGVWYIFRADY